jgi:hypothetical protein
MEHFTFRGFTPDDALALRADRALDRIMGHAPNDARITAVLELENDVFHCSLEISSSTYPLSVETSHKIASMALDKAELAALRKLGRWAGMQFLQMEDAPLRAPIWAAT